jgi:glycine/D-amino acid oxidase-like deaminating enzyme
MRDRQSRRRFLAGSLGGVALATTALGAGAPIIAGHAGRRAIPGGIKGASWQIGHRLRQDAGTTTPTDIIDTDIAIIGGGIAGLSAAWKLARSGFNRFQLVEMEAETGGNARSGRNDVSAYPWGAHYVPIASLESKPLVELFVDLGLITGFDTQGLPIYDTLQICSDPQERLFIRGRWQEDIVPALGVPEAERQQMKQFFEHVETLRSSKGADGKPLFAIPVDASSQDQAWLDLDRRTIKDYLLAHGWDSSHLHWYINYCCRDDYGTRHDQVSAWAGLHYFAARRGRAANVDAQAVVTWPQGNAWLADRLAAGFADRIRRDQLATRLARTTDGVEIDLADAAGGKTSRIRAKAAILCVPQFIAQHLAPFLMAPADSASFTYAPWMVAAITLDRKPAGPGTALAWDNVAYGGKSLGYVLATHQSLDMMQEQTVISLYWPLSDGAPKDERQAALSRSYDDWQDMIVAELETLHPGIHQHISNIGVWLWGHGMIRPLPGFIWGEARRQAARPQPPIFRAHSDLSGISIFEEAQHRGVAAAEQAMTFLQHPFGSSL